MTTDIHWIRVALACITSGAEIALELAATHPVFLAGRPTPHIPDAVFRLADGLTARLAAAFVNGVLTRATPIGRRVARGFHSGGRRSSGSR